MNTEVLPWFDICVHQGDFISADDIRIHYYIAVNPREKAGIVISHGFCEFIGRYQEMMYRYYQEGYSVYFLEYRGYGKSQRTVPFDDNRVIVGSFDEYVDDLDNFIEKVVKVNSLSDRLFLFGHSMGGCISVLYMEEHPETFTCAVLSAPMLEMNFGPIPDPAVDAMVLTSRLIRIDTRYVPGQGPFNTTPDHIHSNCQDEDRYYYQFNMRMNDPDFQTWGATWAWTRAARIGSEKASREVYKLKTPVLLCQAGLDTMVNNDGQDHFADKSPYVSIVRYDDAKHELCNAFEETREKFYADVLRYYATFCNKR